MQGIKISTNYVGARSDIALLTIAGYIDTTTCHDLTTVLRDLAKQNRFMIVADLGGVSYISSAGWGVFVGEIKNIRERGGDLKIVQMNPEVFEVFEMLEFNRILNYYDSIEETINEFDIIRGIDITFIEEGKLRQGQTSTPPMVNFSTPPILTKTKGTLKIKTKESKIPIKDFPLSEKLKMIVLEDPLKKIRGIQNTLKTEEYGNIKIKWFKLRAILKVLNLENKQKRYRYYRSR